MDIVEIILPLLTTGLGAAVTALWYRKKNVAETDKTKAETRQITDDIYLKKIDFLVKELDGYQKTIEGYRKKPPSNGEAMDEWSDSVVKMGQELLRAYETVRVFRSQFNSSLVVIENYEKKIQSLENEIIQLKQK